MRTSIPLLVVVVLLALAEGTARAQDLSKVPRIGIVATGSAKHYRSQASDHAFLRGLEELGYIEGKNVVIEKRYAGGTRDLLPQLAAELVRLKVSVIVAYGPIATRSAMKATKKIPIVMVGGGKPVTRGLVDSLVRPGGNVTGLASYVKGLNGKQMELLKESFPRISRVTLLNGGARKRRIKKHQTAGKGLGLDVQIVTIHRSEGIEGAFAEVMATRPDALFAVRSKLIIRYAKEIADLAVKNRLPSMYQSKRFVNAGGLMSYGPDYASIYRRAADYVDKILKGANPATLPVEPPPKLEFIINLKTARKIGVTIPPGVLMRADEVIK